VLVVQSSSKSHQLECESTPLKPQELTVLVEDNKRNGRQAPNLGAVEEGIVALGAACEANPAVQRGRGTVPGSLFRDRRGIRKKEKTMTANTRTVPAIARKLKSSKVSWSPIPLVWME
jgi:hypothetical protein